MKLYIIFALSIYLLLNLNVASSKDNHEESGKTEQYPSPFIFSTTGSTDPPGTDTPPTSPNTTAAPPITTPSTTAKTSPTTPSTTTTTTTPKPTPSSSTTHPTTSSTNGTTTTTTTTPPPTPQPAQRQFDVASFIGGFVLASGLMAIGIVSWRFYISRQDNLYHTL